MLKATTTTGHNKVWTFNTTVEAKKFVEELLALKLWKNEKQYLWNCYRRWIYYVMSLDATKEAIYNMAPTLELAPEDLPKCSNCGNTMHTCLSKNSDPRLSSFPPKAKVWCLHRGCIKCEEMQYRVW